MTLGDSVNSMPEDETLYIGTQSGYIFVGTKAEFWRDVEEITKLHAERLHRKIEIAKSSKDKKVKALVDLKNRIPESEEKISVYEIVIGDMVRKFNDTANMPASERQKVAAGMSKKIENLNNYLNRERAIRDDLKRRVERMEREIKNCQIIIDAAPEKLAGFSEFENRRVRRVKKLDLACVDMVGTQILAYGEELGDWWTLKEYQNKRCDDED